MTPKTRAKHAAAFHGLPHCKSTTITTHLDLNAYELFQLCYDVPAFQPKKSNAQNAPENNKRIQQANYSGHKKAA